MDIREGERLDELHRKGYRILQKPDRFRFGIDAVLLADFARAAEGDKVLDLGSGTGILPILMKARYEGARYTGIEILEDMADMAGRSVELNGLTDSIRILTGDIKRITEFLPKASFNVVTANPPYIKVPSGLKNRSEAVSAARHEIFCTLRDVAEAASAMLRFHGRFYMVHRPTRLAEIMEELQRVSLEPKKLRFVHPFIDKEPNMVLIEAVRNGGRELKVMPPLILYEAPGRYHPEVYRIYGYPNPRPQTQ